MNNQKTRKLKVIALFALLATLAVLMFGKTAVLCLASALSAIIALSYRGKYPGFRITLASLAGLLLIIAFPGLGLAVKVFAFAAIIPLALFFPAVDIKKRPL